MAKCSAVTTLAHAQYISHVDPNSSQQLHIAILSAMLLKIALNQCQVVTQTNKSCRRTASSPAGYILYCNIFIIKPYNIGHTDLDVFVCKSFCHIDIIIQV